MVEPAHAPQGDQAVEDDLPTVSLGACVADLTNAVAKGMADETEPYGLIPVEFSLLKVCLERDECTATQLAEVLPVDASRISRIVNRLVKMGLLHRRRLASDRRVVILTLTPEGAEQAGALDRRIQMYDAKLVEGISEQKMRDFADTVVRIVANHTDLRSSQ